MRAIALLLALAACGDDGGVRHLPDARPFNAPPGIYVTNGDAVLVFDLAARGNAAPLRAIRGASTGLDLPIGIDLDSDGLLYIANRDAGTVTIYPKDGAGDLAPLRTITGIGSAEGLPITATDELFVSGCPSCGGSGGGTDTIYHVQPGATAHDYTIGGVTTMITAPSALAYDKSTGELYVASSFGGNIAVFTDGLMGNVEPTRSFDPAASNLQSMTYSNGTVFITQPSAGIWMFDAQSTGTPTPMMMPFTTPLVVSYPAGLFLDPSGPNNQPVIYLADYSGSAIHIISTAGTAPNLTVASVESIRGAATELAAPLGIRVVP